MNFEWDERKRAANLAKHGIDFALIAEFSFEDAVTVIDDRHDYGEVRELAIGPINGRLHVLTLTRRASAIRVIGLRKANDREVKRYEQTR
jgi:uncharacterized DUF497 family protein